MRVIPIMSQLPAKLPITADDLLIAGAGFRWKKMSPAPAYPKYGCDMEKANWY